MRTAFLSLAVAVVFSGCGYKGPLYLPKPKPVAQKPAAPATSPAPAATPAPSQPDDATRQ